MTSFTIYDLDDSNSNDESDYCDICDICEEKEYTKYVLYKIHKFGIENNCKICICEECIEKVPDEIEKEKKFWDEHEKIRKQEEEIRKKKRYQLNKKEFEAKLHGIYISDEKIESGYDCPCCDHFPPKCKVYYIDEDGWTFYIYICNNDFCVDRVPDTAEMYRNNEHHEIGTGLCGIYKYGEEKKN